MAYFQFRITVLFLLFSTIVFGQSKAKDFETDYFIDSKGMKLNCKITQIKNGKVKYRLFKKSQPFVVNLMNLKDIGLGQSSDIPAGWKNDIPTPAKGYAHVYFYSAMWPGASVIYNGEELFSLKIRTFYMHKIEIDKEHTYYCKGNKEEDKIKITPSQGDIYYIHPLPPVYTRWGAPEHFFPMAGMPMNGMPMAGGIRVTKGISLTLKNDLISEYMVRSMSRQSH